MILNKSRDEEKIEKELDGLLLILSEIKQSCMIHDGKFDKGKQ